jgi:mannose-1-phosphate guanylyltransferase
MEAVSDHSSGQRRLARGNVWAIVLAGGEGHRLRALTRRICGDERPKQYAALLGSRTLLEQTLDRVALSVPVERTVVVTHQRHAGYIAGALPGRPMPRQLAQPDSRGTAAAVFLPMHWIAWHDPDAIVIVFPSDHFIPDARAFMRHVDAVASCVREEPSRLVLLGARPTDPETEFGWIEPRTTVADAAGEPVCQVRRFIEKPSLDVARGALAAGCLWNTFVFAVKASTLIAEGHRVLPELNERLARIAPFADTEDEPWAIQQAYALAQAANFSRTILEASTPMLAVSRLPTLTWSDWGTPHRVLQSLRGAGISPPWLAHEGEPAEDLAATGS